MRAGFTPGALPGSYRCGCFSFRVLFLHNRGLFRHCGPVIGLSNESTVQGVIHYPRPIFDQALIAPDSGAWQVPNAPSRARKEESPSKDKRDDKMDSRAIAVAKAGAPNRSSEIKRNVVKFARLQKPRAPVRPRERWDRGYAVAFGSSEGSGYRPGLDAQR